MAVTVCTRSAMGEYLRLYNGAGSAGSDVVIDTTGNSPADLSKYDYFVVGSLTGTLTVEFSPNDGTDWYPLGFTPLSIVDTTPLLTTVANEACGFSGCFRDIRVTAATAATQVFFTASKLRG